jgi:hypothetical protein
MKEKLNQDISWALVVFRNSPAAGENEIFQKLVKNGIDRRCAARLAVFILVAYCRMLLSASGVQFSNNFRQRLPDGSLSSEALLSAEPFWEQVLGFAKAHLERGISKEDLLLLAGRSAEFAAANQLLNRGSKLEDMAFTAAVLDRGENGPDSEA